METAPNSAESYDFIHPDHKINSDWPVLNLISKNTAIEFEEQLKKQFQFPIAVKSSAASLAKYKDVFSEIDVTKLVHEVSMPPLSGGAWFCVDRTLIYALAEKYFGGKSELSDTVKNPTLSNTERRLRQYFINCLEASIPSAWTLILEIDRPVISEITLDRLSHSVDDQVVVVCNYIAEIDNTEFNIELIYSHSMLEPHQKILQRIKQQTIAGSSDFSSALKNELLNCEIDMQAVLAETKISLAELIELKAGDFIPLREIENVSFKSNSAPLFDARVGKSNGQVSASFSRWSLQSVS